MPLKNEVIGKCNPLRQQNSPVEQNDRTVLKATRAPSSSHNFTSYAHDSPYLNSVTPSPPTYQRSITQNLP
jgi:hypothetical protein